MKASDIFREITPAGRILGIIFLLIGVAMSFAAYSANSEVAAIGVSTDPALIQKFNDFAHQRDVYTILAISAFFLGAFSVTLMAEKSINPLPAEAEMISQARMASQMIVGLNLNGNATYIPAKGALTSERIFIPATKTRVRIPNAITDDLVLSPGKDGSTPGAILTPSGVDLLLACEKESKRDFSGIGLEALEADMQTLRYGYGLMKDFHIKESGEGISLRVEYSALRQACRTVRKEFPDTCRQFSCFGCAGILAGIARATGQAIQVKDVDNSQDRVLFRLERV